MGHRKVNAPRRGSLAYLPRGRAKRQVARIRFWPNLETGPGLLGYMGYKAGMTYVFTVEDRAGSPNFGKEIISPVTVLDVPPILVCAIRSYKKSENSLRTFTEAWLKDPPDYLDRVFTLPEKFDPDKQMKTMAKSLDKIEEFRLITSTQPHLTCVQKKKPEVMEIKVNGGSINEQFEYAKSLLGKTISVTEIFKEGQLVDVAAITKGKGWQGPVKRLGVKIRARKSRKTKRGIATLGPWNPSRVLYTVARAGQMGYNQRTEYNKRIMRIGTDGEEVTPKGGFIRYGTVRGPYLLLAGSLPGPAKRLIRLRYPARPPKKVPETPPTINQISLQSLQGK